MEDLDLCIDFDTDSMSFQVSLPDFGLEDSPSRKKKVFEFVSKFWKQDEVSISAREYDTEDRENTSPFLENKSKKPGLVRRKSLEFFKKRKANFSQSPEHKPVSFAIKVPSPKGIRNISSHLRTSRSLSDITGIKISASFSRHSSNTGSAFFESAHSDSTLFDSIDSSRSSLMNVFSPPTVPKGTVAFKDMLRDSSEPTLKAKSTLKPILKNRNRNLNFELESVRRADMVDLDEFLKQFEASEREKWERQNGTMQVSVPNFGPCF